LIVDDNAVVRSALRGFLEDVAKMDVCGEAGDGYAAIEAAKKAQPQLVLMDVSMPVMNGIEAASVIRAIAPDTRIILFTMFADDLGHSIARAAGIDLIISKSDGAPALIAALRRVLPESSSPASA
jgi:two-component system, NarL family, nitrate/nitrite response regulator NarL